MKIEHVALWVKDLEKAKDFFVKYFQGKAGAIYRHEEIGFSSYFVSFDDGSRLELMHSTNSVELPKNSMALGYIHMAMSVGSREKVVEITEQLKKDGYVITSNPRVTGDGYFESQVKIFEDNLIEITE